MANAATLISSALTFYGNAASTDGNSTAQRAIALNRLKEAFEEFWWVMAGADFTRRKSTAVSIASGANSTVLPSDFFKFDDKGRVILRVSSDDRRILTPLPDGEIWEMQEVNGTRTAVPEFYCVGSQNSTDLLPELQFNVLSDATYTLSLLYMAVPPTLTDADSNSSGVQYVPTEHHQSVLFKGLLAKMGRDAGDSRAAMFQQEFERAMALAKATRDHGQEDGERIARGGYSAWEMY